MGTEVEFQHSAKEHRADLVFRGGDGDLVVVETEVGDPQENSAFQIRRYMETTGARLGVLITARPSNPELEELVAEALADMGPEKPTMWLWYDLVLTPVAAGELAE